MSSAEGDVRLTTSSTTTDSVISTLSGSTVTITADGNDVTMGTTTADAVIVSGSADVDLGTADVTVINAEIATGDITANITNAGDFCRGSYHDQHG